MKRFKNILYFADKPNAQPATLERAVALAQSNEARLTVMDVIEESNLSSEVKQRLGLNLDELLQQRRLEELEALIEPLQGSGGLIYTQVISGTPFIELVKAVQRNGFDLLIKESHPTKGFVPRLRNSTDMHILRKCPCPVWIDSPESTNPYRNILVAVNPTETSSNDLNRLIMDLASSLAERESAHLHIVHAWRLEGETMLRSGRASVQPARLQQVLQTTEQIHSQKLNDLLAHYGLTTESPNVTLVKSRAGDAVLDMSEKVSADLIVMGTVGRTGIPGLFIGNTAEDVLQSTKASVLAVKPSGFESPIT